MTTVERDPTQWSRAGRGEPGGLRGALQFAGAQRVVPPSVEVGDTIRMLTTTGSTEVRAPDGGIKFREGLVVLVDDVDFDALTARRWVRNRLAEVFPGGIPGDIVTAEERTADPEDLDAQIARLQQLRERSAALAAERAQAMRDGVAPRVHDPDAAIGTARYREGGPAARPPSFAGLADQQIEALERAGFTTQAQIDDATDDEILEVRGVGRPTLNKLRGRAE